MIEVAGLGVLTTLQWKIMLCLYTMCLKGKKKIGPKIETYCTPEVII